MATENNGPVVHCYMCATNLIYCFSNLCHTFKVLTLIECHVTVPAKHDVHSECFILSSSKGRCLCNDLFPFYHISRSCWYWIHFDPFPSYVACMSSRHWKICKFHPLCIHACWPAKSMTVWCFSVTCRNTRPIRQELLLVSQVQLFCLIFYFSAHEFTSIQDKNCCIFCSGRLSHDLEKLMPGNEVFSFFWKV